MRKMKAKILERCLERITIKVSRENTLMIPKKDSNENKIDVSRKYQSKMKTKNEGLLV